MQVRQEDKNGIVVCYITGEIDINTSPQVKKIFDRIVGEKKEKIVINFKNVSYIDSSGLATLVEILKGMRTYGGKLKLSNLSTKVKNLFEITKLEKLFDITQEEGDAIKSLS
ncbi:MAG: STAS domain-containing protein [Candidatus Omnitrophica bacterium]|nr:STAS domain-containing protein [Candidatus Omnitrophota bacterium]